MVKHAGSSFSSLISLVFFYLFLIALMALFATQVIGGRAAENDLYMVILWFAALVVPVVLLFSILSNLLRLFRERKLHAPGAILKTRLMLFFLIIVLLSTGPQAAISLSFIRFIGDTWFSDEIGEGLSNSLEITLEVQQSLSENLEEFVYSSLFESLAPRAGENPERFYVQLRQIRPSLDAFQLFDDKGEMIFLGGDEEARISYSDLLLSQEGVVVRDIRQDRSFIRIRRTLDQESGQLVAVLMESLPEGFGTRTLQILRAREIFTQYRDVKNLLYTGIIVFYGIFTLPLIFLAILSGFYLSDVLIRPIVSLEMATRRIAEGDFSFRILSRSREELGHLVESFNSMIAELERSRNQLVQSERISAWKDIAQRLAHEIKNPLTPIKLSAERLMRKYERQAPDFEQTLRTSVGSITREVDHLAGLLTEFRDFARLPFPKPEQVPLIRLIREVLEIHPVRGVDIIMEDIDDSFTLFVDPAQFRQVLSNLVKNALDALEEASAPPQLAFSARRLSSSGKQFTRIQVDDNGPGMDAQQLEQIFNPYYTTKEHGTGLGLAIVQRIIQDHGGEIRVESEPGTGTRFFIDLPLSEN